MQFKIKSIKIKISFSFLLFFLIFALNDSLDVYLKALFTSILHEAVHIIFIYFFKDGINEIKFNLLGGEIKKADKKILSNNKEAVVNLSAPVFNIISGFIILIFDIDSQLAYINLFIGLFNILPFYNFDGGRGIFFLLTDRFDSERANRIVFLLSVAITFVFTLISLIVFFLYNKNYVFMVMSIYMIVTLFLFKNL